MKTCFVICPLDIPKSPIRIRADAVLDQIIRPVITALGYDIDRADLTSDQWTIPESISKHIFEDDLVIADLTDCNPNVFYELGKRHAWGGHTIHLVQDLDTLPFDIKHHRVIKYDLRDAERLDQVRKELRLATNYLEKVPAQCPFPLTPEKIIELSNATIVVSRTEGRRDHYYIAQKLAEQNCKKLFLMQRSSSLILGPEQGWAAEETFYRTLLDQIKTGCEFFHIVSLEGITRHLERPQSIFPSKKDALEKLSNEDQGVGIKGPSKTWYFKRIPDVEDDHDLKPDRQARTLLIQYPDGHTEGVLVLDLGGKQSCFHLRGPMMNDFLLDCIEFYRSCPLLKWSELEKII